MPCRASRRRSWFRCIPSERAARVTFPCSRRSAVSMASRRISGGAGVRASRPPVMSRPAGRREIRHLHGGAPGRERREAAASPRRAAPARCPATRAARSAQELAPGASRAPVRLSSAATNRDLLEPLRQRRGIRTSGRPIPVIEVVPGTGAPRPRPGDPSTWPRTGGTPPCAGACRRARPPPGSRGRGAASAEPTESSSAISSRNNVPPWAAWI